MMNLLHNEKNLVIDQLQSLSFNMQHVPSPHRSKILL